MEPEDCKIKFKISGGWTDTPDIWKNVICKMPAELIRNHSGWIVPDMLNPILEEYGGYYQNNDNGVSATLLFRDDVGYAMFLLRWA